MKLIFCALNCGINNRLFRSKRIACPLATILKMTSISNGGDDNDNKKRRVTIGTHGGIFHCDDALACFMLKLLPAYKSAEIIRTRDQKVLDGCDVVVDVGGEFDPTKYRFDHHQRSFTQCMNDLKPQKPFMTKLSSAGLVYTYLGDKVIAELIGKQPEDPVSLAVYDKVYENFVEEIDAVDNGVNIADGELRYNIRTGVSSRVANLNPWWNKPVSNDEMNVLFEKAMSLVGFEFVATVNSYANNWWPAKEVVLNAIANRYQVDESGEILDLSTGGCPWKQHLYTIEETEKLEPTIKFVLFQDSSNKSWRVQAVSVSPYSFQNRISLPKSWLGLRDEELTKVSGIAGCIFAHSEGFIGGNQTRDGALEMARVAIKTGKI